VGCEVSEAECEERRECGEMGSIKGERGREQCKKKGERKTSIQFYVQFYVQLICTVTNIQLF
jgi:hypothetical protein